MKHLKEIGLSILPTTLIFVIAIAMFVVIRTNLIKAETEECWKRLDDEVISLSQEISVRLNDNLEMLELMAGAIQIHGENIGTESFMSYITTTRENTIFKKITIAFPDGTILDEDGTTRTHKGKDPSYEELVENGTGVTARVIDEKFNREVVYCSTPITNSEGEAVALLIGTIDCVNLQEYFNSSIYNGNSSVFIIDRRDGCFIMDSWHNGYLPTLEDMDSDSYVEEIEEKPVSNMIKNGESGRSVNTVEATGSVTYSSFAPIPNTDWEILVTIPKEYIFTTVDSLQSTLSVMAIVGLVLIVLVMGFHILIAISAAKERKRVREFEMEKISNQTKNRFLSTMSHDIRTPLNGIIGMVDIIEKFNDDENRVKDCVKKIKVSANYLLTLTNDVLDLNAIDDGKVLIMEETVDLRKFIDELQTIVEQRTTEAGVTCYMDYSNVEHPRVLTSVIHIRRIMINLISNAIKYSKKNGSVWIFLDEISHDGEYGQYCFTVHDDGIGMTEEFQKTMFNSFEQEKISARSTDEGHGLGLTIVKRLTELMNGSIQVESQKGIGTTFFITLPFRIDTSKPTEIDRENTEMTKVDLTGTHILVVEDNEFNMEIACVQLQYAGAEITSASNGKIALEIFKDSTPGTFDMILMDVMMPEMDGLSATKEIRLLDREDAKTIPIMAMTANAFSSDVKECLDAGMNEHVAKPLDMDIVARKIMKHIKK